MNDKNKIRFWASADVLGDDECWLWRERADGKGYGLFFCDGINFRAPRLAYELEHGQIEDGMWILHDPIVCNNPGCINPAHLRQGTAKENSADRKLAGTHLASDETKKKMSEFQKGRVTSDEAKAKMSKAKKGKIVTDEARRNMSLAKQGKKHNGYMTIPNHELEVFCNLILSGKTYYYIEKQFGYGRRMISEKIQEYYKDKTGFNIFDKIPNKRELSMDELTRAIRLRKSGETFSSIAKEFGVKPDFIRHRLNQFFG